MHRLHRVLLGGVLAGTLDIIFACVFWAAKANVSPLRIFQSVAAGLLGKASFSGGVGTAALGLALHFLMTITMSLAYFMAARQWPLLSQRPWRCGALYGLVLYAVMNYVVVPLSAASPGSRDALWIVLSILALSCWWVFRSPGSPDLLCAAVLRRIQQLSDLELDSAREQRHRPARTVLGVSRSLGHAV